MKRYFLLTLSLLIALSLAAQVQAAGRTHVVLHTTKGDITLALYNETPLHRDNFIRLVQTHFLDSLLFHRVIKDFMIQSGDPTSRHAQPGQHLGAGGPNYTIPAEIKFPQLYHKRGALAAARTADQVNPERRSSGSQFYIVWGHDYSTEELEATLKSIAEDTGRQLDYPEEVKKDYYKHGGTPSLDGAYTVFGEVVDGLNVVDKIQCVQTDYADRPIDDVRILSAEILGGGQVKP